MLPLFLLGVGCVLIFLEFYFAGLILGTLGVGLVLSSVAVFATQYQSLLANVGYIIFSGIAVVCVCRFAIWKVKATKSRSSLYSENNQEGFTASTYNKTLIGKEGVVIADLKPGGYILVEGLKEPAISLSGYITKGESVLVVGGEGESLTVYRNDSLKDKS